MKIIVLGLTAFIAAQAHAAQEFSVLPGDEVKVECQAAVSNPGNYSSIESELAVGNALESPPGVLRFETWAEFSSLRGIEAKSKNGALQQKEKFLWEYSDDIFRPKPSSFAAGTITFEPSDAAFANVTANFGTPTRNSKPLKEVSAIQLASGLAGASSFIQYKKDAPYATACKATPLCRDHGKSIRVAVGTPGSWSGVGSGFWDACEAFGKPRFRKLLMEIQEADGAPWLSLLVTSLQADPSQRTALETAMNNRRPAPSDEDWNFFKHSLVPQIKRANAAADPAERERLLSLAREDQIAYLLR